MKKIILLILSMTILLSTFILPTAAAKPDDTIVPMWDNTSNIDYCITYYENNVGYAACSIIAKHSPKIFKIDLYVYVYTTSGWQYLAEAHKNSKGMSTGIDCTFDAVPGVSYKADFIFSVIGNGKNEVITESTIKNCPRN